MKLSINTNIVELNTQPLVEYDTWINHLTDEEKFAIYDNLNANYQVGVSNVIYMMLLDPACDMDIVLPSGWRHRIINELHDFMITTFHVWYAVMLHKTLGFSLNDFGVKDETIVMVRNSAIDLITAGKVEDAVALAAWTKLIRPNIDFSPWFLGPYGLEKIANRITEIDQIPNYEEALTFLLAIKIIWPERFSEIDLASVGLDRLEGELGEHWNNLRSPLDRMKLLALLKLVTAPELDLNSPSLLPVVVTPESVLNMPTQLIY